MELSSPAFRDGGRIPQKHSMPGAGGDNLSIPFSWKNPPAGTKSFVLSIVDIHPVANCWVHWLVISIPADTALIREGASGRRMPRGSLELRNSFGNIGYGGPQPPKGTGDHPYVTTLYALNSEKISLGPNTNLSAFERALEGKILASVKITGIYSR